MQSSEIIDDKIKERIEKCLLNFRKAEEINDEELTNFNDDQNKYKIIVDSLTKVKKQDVPLIQFTEEKQHLETHTRAYIFSVRKANAKSSTFSIAEFEKSLVIHTDPMCEGLLKAVYSVFDIRFGMRLHYYFIFNSAVLQIIKKSNLEPLDIIKYARPWLNNFEVISRLESFDESDGFGEDFRLFLKMALEIKNPQIHECLIPFIPDGKLIDFVKDDDDGTYYIEFSEDHVYKLRKNIAASIDVVIPKRIKVKVENEDGDTYFKFFGDLPYGKLAHYGSWWLASISKFRLLSKEERKSIHENTGALKHVHVTLNIALKFYYILKLLGVTQMDKIYLSYSTLWYYFKSHGGIQDDSKHDDIHVHQEKKEEEKSS